MHIVAMERLIAACGLIVARHAAQYLDGSWQRRQQDHGHFLMPNPQ